MAWRCSPSSPDASPSHAATSRPTSSSAAAGCSRSSRASGSTSTSRSRTAGSPASATYDGARDRRRARRATSCRASSTRTCTSSRRSSCPTSSRGSCCRSGRPPSSPTRTRSRTCSAPTASTGCSTRRADIPLDVYFMASSCVPASSFESPRRALSEGDLEALLRRRRVLGVAEMMNFPGVIAGDEARAREARARRRTSTATRRACAAATCRPTRRRASAPTTRRRRVDEGRERLRAGMWLLIREASAARNLRRAAAARRGVRPAPDGVLHRRPRARAHRRGRAHQRDGARRGRVRRPARGRARHGVAQPGALPRARAPRRDRARAAGRPAVLLGDLETFVPELVLKRGQAGRGDPARDGARLGAAHRADRRARAGGLPDPVGGRRARA